MTDSRTALVARGYDAMSDDYLSWSARIEGDPKVAYVERLSAHLERGARVLELGCGAGEPCTRLLAERFDVTGVDVSAEQLARARNNVPRARFLLADATTLELETESFEAVLALYLLNHVPRELLAGMLERIATWLAPGGWFLASFGAGDEAEWIGDWLGTTMFFSSWDAQTNRRLVLEAGLEIVTDDLVAMREPEPDGEATFHWVLARR